MSKARRTGKSLADVLGASIAQEAQVEQPVVPAKTQAAPAQPEGVPLSILVTAADRRRLRQLSLDADMSLQRLGHAAWNLLLRERGLPELEPLTANRPSGRKRE
jgi:hypothetical protein